MTLILEQIKALERVCEAANSSTYREDGSLDYILTPQEGHLLNHAKIQFPIILKLVGEMYHSLGHVLQCKAEDEETYLPAALCLRCNDARRLIEKMEEEK